MTNPRTASRRERRKAAKHRKVAAVAVVERRQEAVLLADGVQTFRLQRKARIVELTPSPDSPRRDVFDYFPGTWVIRGLTPLVRSQKWRLVR